MKSSCVPAQSHVEKAKSGNILDLLQRPLFKSSHIPNGLSKYIITINQHPHLITLNVLFMLLVPVLNLSSLSSMCKSNSSNLAGSFESEDSAFNQSTFYILSLPTLILLNLMTLINLHNHIHWFIIYTKELYCNFLEITHSSVTTTCWISSQLTSSCLLHLFPKLFLSQS